MTTMAEMDRELKLFNKRYVAVLEMLAALKVRVERLENKGLPPNIEVSFASCAAPPVDAVATPQPQHYDRPEDPEVVWTCPPAATGFEVTPASGDVVS